jgi:hypothetical protein
LRRVAADDGIGAEHAGLVAPHVHRAAAPATIAGRQAHDLGHRAVDCILHRRRKIALARIVALRHFMKEEAREELVMGAVGAVDLVAGAEQGNGGDGAALLADAGMSRAMYAARLEQFQQALLEFAHDHELLKQPRQHDGVFLFPVRLGGFDAKPGGVGLERHEFRHGFYLHLCAVHRRWDGRNCFCSLACDHITGYKVYQIAGRVCRAE